MSFHEIATSLEPFMNKDGETFIVVQSGAGERPEQVAMSSDLARKLVRSKLCPLFTKGFATDHETRVAIEVIEAFAFQNPRKEAEANLGLDMARKPLARAVLAIARSGGTKKDLPQLLAMLLRTAQRHAIDFKKGPWPENVDALGKQLSSLIALMEKMGVILQRHETERPRTWSISALFDESEARDADVTAVTTVPASNNNDSDTSPSLTAQLAELTDDDIMAQINGDPE